MSRVLVTGGTGMLGRRLVGRLTAAGRQVRVMSRHVVASPSPSVETVVADLMTGEHLDSALDGVTTVIHAASQPVGRTEQVDVDGTRLLLECARAARVSHFIYVSIVGIDRVPYAYYRYKLAAEALIAQGGVPWSIQRATQFYGFVDALLQRAAQLPLPVLPLPTDMRLQPIDVDDVAERLCQTAAGAPSERLPDLGGPQILSLGEIAAAWRAARGIRKPVMHLPLPGEVLRAFRQGHATTPDHRSSGVTWADWLSRPAT